MRRRSVLKQEHLSLAPMVDVLTVLLIFLILSFATDQTTSELAHGKDLPKTAAKQENSPFMKLTISAKGVGFNNQNFSTFEELDTYLTTTSLTPQKILISVDRKFSYESVEKIMARLTRIGFTEFDFLAERVEEGLQ
jgi:biopolymer transport protein ExbD